MSTEDTERERRLRQDCTRFLHWHGDRSPAQQLAEVDWSGVEADRYGEGGVVAQLEQTVAALLGKPAALFVPSGTMAQQAVLRVHADRRGRQTVAWHPTCHLQLHEDQAHQRLHGLIGRPVGDARALLTLDDLQGIGEPLAALLLELPQREIGGQLPSWDDLTAQVAWARDHDAAVHLDGARLWDAQPFYDRPHAEIARLFDSVYVSFYKLLGGLSGACLAGEEDVIAQARQWRQRHGGTLHGLWPNAASALAALDRRLPRIPRYVEHAAKIGAALRDVPGVEVVPDPPVTPMLHLLLAVEADALRQAGLRIAEQERIWTWADSMAGDSPRHRRVELTVGDATLTFSPDEVAELVGRLATGAGVSS